MTHRQWAPLRRQLDHPPDPQGLERTKAAARRAFAAQEALGRLHWPEFLYQQGQFLQKRWWVLQGLILLGLWAALRDADSSLYVQRILSISAPLFVLLLLPELWKSRRCNALEVEGSAYYSLRQVYAARMILFAGGDFLLLTLFFLAMGLGGGLRGEFALQFFLPFSVTCCICFRTLYSRLSEPFALLLCVVWAVVWMEVSSLEAVYQRLTPPLWGGLLALSLGYLAYCVARGQRELPNLWEGIPQWN